MEPIVPVQIDDSDIEIVDIIPANGKSKYVAGCVKEEKEEDSDASDDSDIVFLCMVSGDNHEISNTVKAETGIQFPLFYS